MRLLLDTHVLLWAAAGSDRLSGENRELLEDARHEVLYSAASLWEIAIKSALRRKDFHVDLALLLATLPAMERLRLLKRAIRLRAGVVVARAAQVAAAGRAPACPAAPRSETTR